MTPADWLTHGRMRLAMYRLRDAPSDARCGPLLLLHGLGERSPDVVPATVAAWPGSIAALDFTGHGASGVSRGGGYDPEILVGDVDAALFALGGAATLLGHGLGAYVALLVAGARPERVRGTILCDGPGLTGGGPEPTAGGRVLAAPSSTAPSVPDPFALLELSHDARPPDYALGFLALARRGARTAPVVTICAKVRPTWLGAVAAAPGAAVATLPEALAGCAARWTA
jgi:pimeloyl-ACP methyl ester carboxylesterase